MRTIVFFILTALSFMGSSAQNRKDSYCPDDNHPHIIDLGTGVKWACCNVGANAPHKEGFFLAWGESKEKPTYTVTNHYHYRNDGDFYLIIGSDIGGTDYDPATKLWDCQTMKENVGCRIRKVEAKTNETKVYLEYMNKSIKRAGISINRDTYITCNYLSNYLTNTKNIWELKLKGVENISYSPDKT